MMDLFRQWLISVTGITLLIAMAEALMPQGSVKQVGKFICGLLLLLTIIKPLMYFSLDIDVSMLWKEELEVQGALMEEQYQGQIKTIIEEELGAYILDKAKEAEALQGVVVPTQVAVHCELDEEGLFLPSYVELHGVELEDQEFFRTVIGQDLGVMWIEFKEVTEDGNQESFPVV